MCQEITDHRIRRHFKQSFDPASTAHSLHSRINHYVTSQTINNSHLEARLLATVSVLYCSYMVLYKQHTLHELQHYATSITLLQSLKGAEQVQNCKATKRHSEGNIFCATAAKKIVIGLFSFSSKCSSTASEAFHNHKIPQQRLKTICVSCEAPLLNVKFI